MKENANRYRWRDLVDSFEQERGIPRDSFTEMLALPSLRHFLVALRTKLFENLMVSLKKLSVG